MNTKIFKDNITLDELIKDFPEIWKNASSELLSVIEKNDPGKMQEYINSLNLQTSKIHKELQIKKRIISDKNIPPVFVKAKMISLAMDNICLSAATGIKEGRIRFNLWNGHLIQKLLFKQGFERKPVSLFWFNLIWPLVYQKRYLMPLIKDKGIYCFYSREFIDSLVKLIGNKKCLEIAAGDGTLYKFLKTKGIDIIATDDYSWSAQIPFPDYVEKRNAESALNKYKPQVVICSWPPAGNQFEKFVFSSKSVELYIVIGSRHKYAAGNWKIYLEQKSFNMSIDDYLAKLILPPELDSSVIVFQKQHE